MKLIIEAIEEKLQSLKNELYFKDLQIAELRAQLEHAETNSPT